MYHRLIQIYHKTLGLSALSHLISNTVCFIPITTTTYIQIEDIMTFLHRCGLNLIFSHIIIVKFVVFTQDPTELRWYGRAYVIFEVYTLSPCHMTSRDHHLTSHDRHMTSRRPSNPCSI